MAKTKLYCNWLICKKENVRWLAPMAATPILGASIMNCLEFKNGCVRMYILTSAFIDFYIIKW